MNYLKLKTLALAIGLIIVTDMAVADTWNSTSIYTKGDQIEYQNITYIAQWWTKDEAPSASNTGSLWLKVTDPNVNEEYSNSTSYHADDRVVYQGNTFKAQWFTINTTPDASEDSTTPWVNPWELTTVTTAPATLISSTTPVNNAPIAQDDSESTNENTGVTINVLANDSDAENDALTLNTNSLTQPSYGSIEVTTPGIISYTPDADITTTVVDTFTYTVTDGSSDSNSATVSVTVIATETPVLPVSNTYPQYPAGMTYEAGDIVSNNGNLYQCKPWPYTGWCSRETSAYEPGVGTHWTEAWAIVSGTTSAPLAINDSTAEPNMHPDEASEFIDLATFGLSYGSDHVDHRGLVGGRTAITTEALFAYNNLRVFIGLAPATLDQVGAWAFTNNLTNNTQSWGNDQMGVGLWYAMQGAKVGWMADDLFDPQVVADIERTARLGAAEDVMAMVATYGHEGFAEYLTHNGLTNAFINTLKMEPHYAGWMHDRAHGWLSIENVAIAHDVNHLTVLSHDQMQPFMNDTWDWPQWPALQVSHARVLEYFQSIVVLGDPLGDHLRDLPAPTVQTDPDMSNI